MFVLALLGLALAMEVPSGNYPQNFNWYETNPACVQFPYDSGKCFNHHSFAVTAALQTRFCIRYPAYRIILSPQYLISCNQRVMGCAATAGHYDHMYDLDFVAINGLPNDNCLPFSAYAGAVAQCPGYCQNRQPILPNNVYRFGSRYQISGTENIFNEIQQYGPVIGYFNVDSDIYANPNYVHHYNPAKHVGGLYLSVIGWGYSATDGWYFVCQNNVWGQKFGMVQHGLVYIAVADGGADPQSFAASRPL